MPQESGFNGNASIAGPSPDVFYITQAMCETVGITSGQQRGSAIPASPRLPVKLRFVKALAACTVVLQSLGGGTFTIVFAAGDVLDLGTIVALSGLASDTALIGGM